MSTQNLLRLLLLLMLVKILKLKFRQDFEAEIWSVFCLILVEILRLGLVNILKLKLSTNADVEIFRWMLDQDSED